MDRPFVIGFGGPDQASKEQEKATAGALSDAAAGFSDVAKRHGREITVFAQAMKNSTSIVAMAVKHGAPAEFTFVLEQQFLMMSGAWRRAAGFQWEAVAAVLHDLTVHLEIVEADLKTIFPETEAIPPNKEGEKHGD